MSIFKKDTKAKSKEYTLKELQELFENSSLEFNREKNMYGNYFESKANFMFQAFVTCAAKFDILKKR